MKLDRRQVLIGAGACAAACSAVPLRAKERSVALASRGSGSPGLDELAAQLGAVSREQAFDVAVRAIEAGATPQDLLGAVLVAGVHDIRPRHLGGKLHALMMVESAFQLAADAPRDDAWLLALWNLDDLKVSQELDRDDGDWTMPPRPDVANLGAAEAARELDLAMEAWDDERADRAITGLVEHHAHDALLDRVWPWACRNFINLGHSVIYAAQLERCLRRIGAKHTEPVLRSIVHALLFRANDGVGDGMELDGFDRARELAVGFPDDWRDGREEAVGSTVVLGDLRHASTQEAHERVLEALRDGVGPRTIWDGLRLLGAEVMLERPRSKKSRDRTALLSVHATTITEAFAYVFRTTRREETQRLALLQAAAWVTRLRDRLGDIVGLELKGAGIDRLGVDPARGLARHGDDPRASHARGRARAARASV